MYVVWGVAKHTAKCRYGISYHLTGRLKWLFIIIPSEIFEDLEGSLQDPCEGLYKNICEDLGKVFEVRLLIPQES